MAAIFTSSPPSNWRIRRVTSVPLNKQAQPQIHPDKVRPPLLERLDPECPSLLYPT